MVTFGVTEPKSVGDYGLLRDNGMVWLVEAHDRDASDEPAPTRRRKNETVSAAEHRAQAPDARRRVAHPRPAQRRERAGRVGAGARGRSARRAACCTACANTVASRIAWK